LLFEAGNGGGIGSTRNYHTKQFRDQCLDFGLCCECLNTRYGWTLTCWPDSGIPDQYKPLIDFLRKNMPAGTGGLAIRKSEGEESPVFRTYDSRLRMRWRESGDLCKEVGSCSWRDRLRLLRATLPTEEASQEMTKTTVTENE